MPNPRPDRAGAAWEALARGHLQANGLRAVAANVGFRFGELDLVMSEGDTVVFVEVRYRKHASFGGGAGSIDPRKCRRIALAAQAFLAAHPALASRPCRFDVVAIAGEPGAPRFDWLRDAFRLDDL